MIIERPYIGRAVLMALLGEVARYGWVFSWGMFVMLLVAVSVSASVFVGSSASRKAGGVVVTRILSLAGVLFILPAFIFRHFRAMMTA